MVDPDEVLRQNVNMELSKDYKRLVARPKFFTPPAVMMAALKNAFTTH